MIYAALLRGINVGVSRLKWDETVYWERTPDDALDMYEMKAGDLVIGMDRPLIAEGIRVAKVKESDLPCLLLQRQRTNAIRTHTECETVRESDAAGVLTGLRSCPGLPHQR